MELTHVSLFNSNNILKVFDLNDIQVGCFMYTAMNNLLSAAFTNLFMLNSIVHSHETRSSSDIHEKLASSVTAHLYGTLCLCLSGFQLHLPYLNVV